MTTYPGSQAPGNMNTVLFYRHLTNEETHSYRQYYRHLRPFLCEPIYIPKQICWNHHRSQIYQTRLKEVFVLDKTFVKASIHPLSSLS